MRVARRSFAVLLAGLAAANAVRAENRPAWRGPTGPGTSPETDLPATWGPTETVRWKKVGQAPA